MIAAPGSKRCSQSFNVLAVGLSACIATTAFESSALAQAKPQPPAVQANGGLLFNSQGEGTPNTFTGYLFAPLSQGPTGSVLFLDIAANLNLGGALTQQTNVSAGASTRLGYRWLSSDQDWMYGFNAGIDTRQAYTSYAFQAGVGAEALNRKVELRLNGYIPFANQADRYGSGWSNATLNNNQLILDGWHRYVVSLGGINLEAGVPLARWSKDSLWLYGSYYYLGGDYISGSSGVRGRAEVRVGSQLALGATLSYDNIFQLQATGYIRYGAKPIAGHVSDAVDTAQREFLALRGLPMQRDTDIRMVAAQQNLPASIALNPGTGAALVVRCTGNTTATAAGSATCAYPSASAMLAAAGKNDALLLGGGATLDLAGQPVDGQGRPTLRLAAGTGLSGSGNAPTVATQFGPVNLTPVFGTSVGNQPAISNGVISIGSNTTISGINFTNTSITNYSTSNVVIKGNTFTGSYSDNPTALTTAQNYGAINVSANALPVIQLQNVDNLTIQDNTFLYPQVQTYVAQKGKLDIGKTQDYPDGMAPVCNQNNLNRNGTTKGGGNTSGLCLSGNAIRLNVVREVMISGNTVTGALDEAFRINNPSGNLTVSNNAISNMRMGPDSNIGTAIIIGQNKGESNITIANNSFANNSPGSYPIITAANQSGVPAATTASASGVKINNIDPIEVGLCRGSTDYPRAQDLYADPNFSGNCNSKTKMTINVSGNRISLPAIQGGIIRQDGDGIDYNIGTNGVIITKVMNNTIETLGGTKGGDNGITFDMRGNVTGNIEILNNSVSDSGDTAIDLGFTNTASNNNPGYGLVTLSGNTATGTTKDEGLVGINLINNPGQPASVLRVDGSDAANVNKDSIQYSNYNTGIYPTLYLNGTLVPKAELPRSQTGIGLHRLRQIVARHQRGPDRRHQLFEQGRQRLVSAGRGDGTATLMPHHHDQWHLELGHGVFE